VADRLVVSKVDIAAPEKASQLAQQLARINPAAEIITSGEDDEAAPELLTGDLHDPASRAHEVRRWLAAESLADGDHHHHDPDRSRHGDIRAMVIAEDQPLDWAAFGLWLAMLLNRHGKDVLRVKGLLRIIDREAPVIVQGVQHTIHKPVHLDQWPDGRPCTRLVLIVRHLEPALIERSFRAFMGLVPAVGKG